MVGAKPISSLVEPGSRLCVGGDPFTDPYLYRSIGFGLCYVIITLPEIVYIVALVLLYDMWPLLALKLRILSAGFVNLCIALLSIIGQQLNASYVTLRTLSMLVWSFIHLKTRLVCFIDASWVSDPDDCLSQHGFSIYFGGNLVGWSSQKQNASITYLGSTTCKRDDKFRGWSTYRSLRQPECNLFHG